ncbi:MAG: MMPL family transporter [Candidatus Omnitrophica bacterium]|nr:MMPL family transporter [Candidatus Omnitrophota bacterium]
MELRARIARKIIHLRIWIILSFILISLFFISVLKDLKIETNLEDFIPQKHLFVKVHNRLVNVFGGLHQVSIALEVKEGTILEKDFLEKLISLTEDIYLLDGVNRSRITSLASRHIKHVVANEEGLFVERLLKLPPQNEEEKQKLKEKILLNPNVYGRIVSGDFKSTLIQVDFESKVKTSYIFEKIMELKKKYQDPNINFYIAGRPILEGWLTYYLKHILRIIIISFIIMAVILYLTFRSKRGVILPLLDSSMATLWGLGMMKILGLKLDPSTILVPFIVLSLGISHSIHSLKRYYEEMRAPNMKSKHAVVNVMSSLFIPGLACVLTDGMGFLSLYFVPLPTIKSMALASGLGILANFPTSFMFTPCVLSFMHRPKVLEVEKEERHPWVDKLLNRLSIFSLSRRAGTPVVVTFMVLSLLAVFGITRIVIGDNTEGSSYLYPNSYYNLSEKFINSQFGGTNTYYILVESDDSVLNTKALKLIDDFQGYLAKEVKEVGSSNSLANAIKALNMFMFDGKREFFKIPHSDEVVLQYWFLYTLSGFPSDYDHLISKDKKITNIKFDLKDHKSSTVEKVVRKTKEYFAKLRENNPRFFFAGGDIGILYAINEIIKNTIIPNAVFILTLIFLYVSFVYRSFVASWILILPLILSNLIVFSLYGFFRTSLTTETVSLASLSMGLGIDYGIYILARFYEDIRNKKDKFRNILSNVLITSGKAVFFSSFIVSLGIAVWLFSEIRYQARLGFNLCLALFLNMLISLVMIPVLIWWIKPNFLFGKVRKRLKRRNFKS